MALDEKILRRLKQQAAKEDRTIADLINELLRASLLARSERRTPFRLALPTWALTLREGVDIADRDRLWDLMEDEK